MKKQGTIELGVQGRDVTIFLEHKFRSATEEAAVVHAKKKKRITMEQSGAEGAASEEIQVVYADSGRLRRCSKYFDTCMSGRWPLRTKSESLHMEFHLEVQTEPLYYRDCFARMDCPFLKPIPDVVYCIQLLKVASQIEYLELMDICVKYLSAAPWSVDEENQIRKFYRPEQVCAESASDLAARLRFPLAEEERKKESSALMERTLSRYLKIALTKDSSFEVRCASRQVFAEAFHALASCPRTPMCREALEYALAIAAKELEEILESMTGPGCQKGWGAPVATVNLLQFCWLFEVLREANAAQVAVELLLKLDVSRVLLTAFDPFATIPTRPEVVCQWANMMYVIFRDVLNGRLFLKTSERVALYQQWNWILKRVNDLAPEEPPVSKVVASFIMSFPHVQQEEIYLRWASSLDEYTHLQGDYNLSQAHTMWMTSLVTAEVPKLTASQSEQNVEKVEYLPRVNSRGGSWDIL
jgi:hypothetical protein